MEKKRCHRDRITLSWALKGEPLEKMMVASQAERGPRAGDQGHERVRYHSFIHLFTQQTFSPILFDKPAYNAAEPRVRVQTKGPIPYAKVFESFKAIYYSVLQNMYYPTIFMMTWKARFKFRILRLLRLPCQNMAAWGGLAPGLWIPNPYPQPVPHFSSSCQLCVPPPAIVAFCTCVGTLQPARWKLVDNWLYIPSGFGMQFVLGKADPGKRQLGQGDPGPLLPRE